MRWVGGWGLHRIVVRQGSAPLPTRPSSLAVIGCDRRESALRWAIPLRWPHTRPRAAPARPACRALGTVLLVAVPPLLVAYLRGLSPLPGERRLDALPGDVSSGGPQGGAGGCRRRGLAGGSSYAAVCSVACFSGLTAAACKGPGGCRRRRGLRCQLRVRALGSLLNAQRAPAPLAVPRTAVGRCHAQEECTVLLVELLQSPNPAVLLAAAEALLDLAKVGLLVYQARKPVYPQRNLRRWPAKVGWAACRLGRPPRPRLHDPPSQGACPGGAAGLLHPSSHSPAACGPCCRWMGPLPPCCRCCPRRPLPSSLPPATRRASCLPRSRR